MHVASVTACVTCSNNKRWEISYSHITVQIKWDVFWGKTMCTAAHIPKYTESHPQHYSYSYGVTCLHTFVTDRVQDHQSQVKRKYI